VPAVGERGLLIESGAEDPASFLPVSAGEGEDPPAVHRLQEVMRGYGRGR
jgi:hypothetical protein